MLALIWRLLVMGSATAAGSTPAARLSRRRATRPAAVPATAATILVTAARRLPTPEVVPEVARAAAATIPTTAVRRPQIPEAIPAAVRVAAATIPTMAARRRRIPAAAQVMTALAAAMAIRATQPPSGRRIAQVRRGGPRWRAGGGVG